MALLPPGIKESELVRDPAGRANHWFHPPTGQSFHMPGNWTPPSVAKSPGDKQEAQAERTKLAGMTKGDMFAYANELGLSGYEKQNKGQLTETILNFLGYGADAKEATPNPDDPYTGKRVAVLVGRFEGRHGVITEPGSPAVPATDTTSEIPAQPFRVIVDGNGGEVSYDAFEGNLRFLTDDEILEDEIALEEQKKAAETRA